jgi:DNA-binding GntR family transcriptional regulator
MVWGEQFHRDAPDVVRMNKSEIIADIKRKIICEDYPPGHYLIEKELCDHYGVSRTPMREILFTLVTTGLVVQQRGKGFSVRTMDIKQVFDIFEARESVEGLAARLCCQKAGTRDHKNLDALRKRLEELDAERHADLGVRLGRELHYMIVELAANSLISDFYEKLDNMTRLTSNMTRKVSTIEKDSKAYHIHVIDAILEGSPQKSEQYMREHIVMTCTHLLHALYPGYRD